MEKKNKKLFTATDYYTVALERTEDLKHLRDNQESIIFSLYCAGTAIECMLRAYIKKHTDQFDSRHDLNELYMDSKISAFLQTDEIAELSNAIRIANSKWKNNLRYTSEIRMKRIIVHELCRSGFKDKFKDINKYIYKNYSELFDATDLIIKIGKEKWKT